MKNIIYILVLVTLFGGCKNQQEEDGFLYLGDGVSYKKLTNDVKGEKLSLNDYVITTMKWGTQPENLHIADTEALNLAIPLHPDYFKIPVFCFEKLLEMNSGNEIIFRGKASDMFRRTEGFEYKEFKQSDIIYLSFTLEKFDLEKFEGYDLDSLIDSFTKQ